MFKISNLRADDSSQLKRLVEYLTSHADEGIQVRPKDQIEHAQSSGLVLVVEHGREICGCSFVYKYIDNTNVFNEIGTVRITENGFRLQQILCQFHIMQMFLEEYDFPTNVTFAVVKSGTASEYILCKYVGTQEWMPPQSLKSLRAEASVPFSSGKHFLVANPACIDRAFREVKKLFVQGDQFNTPNGGGSVQLGLKWLSEGVLFSNF